MVRTGGLDYRWCIDIARWLGQQSTSLETATREAGVTSVLHLHIRKATEATVLERHNIQSTYDERREFCRKRA